MNSIFKLRTAAGLLQKDVADKLGVDRTTVTKWETGEILPRTDKLPALAEVLGCTIDELFKEGE